MGWLVLSAVALAIICLPYLGPDHVDFGSDWSCPGDWSFGNDDTVGSED